MKPFANNVKLYANLDNMYQNYKISLNHSSFPNKSNNNTITCLPRNPNNIL